MKTYPVIIRVSYFKEGDDTRDDFLVQYVTEDKVQNEREEMEFYERLSHEDNLKIDIL